MVNSNNSENSLLYLIKKCEYYNLSEKQSLELINGKLSKLISRSTYYNYKKDLYQDEKFQSLKKSVYKSKLLKCFLLYSDERVEPDGYDIHNLILENFPNREDVFEVTKEQEDKISRIHNRVKSNFCIRADDGDYFYSNLTRVNQLPNLLI